MSNSMVGTTLQDRYRMDSELGRGGMSTVYCAYDTDLERKVAIKLMSAAALGTEGRSRLLHEARAIAKLNHPNIVTVHDVGEVDEAPFIVMELVEGESLHEHGPQDLEALVATTRQICTALEHAHAHGIIHRDLKPENVVISIDGTVKLMDFGLARSMASRLTEEGTISGTVFYMAPEQALGKEFDGRADLYALGVMLYELATGRLPFTSDDPLAVISQHIHAPVVPPQARNPEIPPALDTLIVDLLNKDMDNRPASATEVLAILDRRDILDRDAAPARELSVLERIERGRMVGREEELTKGKALWSKTLSGEGQILLISGEPGVGKTRLVRELMTQAGVSGGQALLGASYAEGNTPYAPFKQILRGIFREPSEDGFHLTDTVLADVLLLVPELCSRYPDVPANPDTEPKADQQRLFENMAIFFTTLSELSPLLLVLEDIHWADSGTLFLMRHLARHTRQSRVMIVAPYREVEHSEAQTFHEVLLDLQREKLGARARLSRLDCDQTNELLEILFAEGTTPEFLEGIYRETEGNPFFIEEVCKALVESGKLQYRDGCWHMPGMAELGIPQSIQVAIEARVRALPPESQDSLQFAAILGREFRFDVLLKASDVDKETLFDALEHTERAQLIEEVTNGRERVYSFTHALIPSTLVSGMRSRQRKRLHRTVADAIEVLDPEDWEALAYHYDEAGEDEKAVHYRLKAGDRARLLFANQEAINHYKQVVDTLREQEKYELAARTLMKLGLTHHNAFEFREARQAFDESYSLRQRPIAARPEGLPPSPHPYRVTRTEPATLDPTISVDGYSNWYIGNLFSGLVERGPGWEIVLDVARNMEISDDGLRYIFHLRDDVFWTDGTQVKARDFVYAWLRILDPSVDSPLARIGERYELMGARAYHRGEIADPEQVGARAIDDFTLELELESPASQFIHILSRVFPVPSHVVEKHGNAWTQPDNIVTNGPFKLESYRPGESINLIRNPDYQGRFSGNLQRVETYLISGSPSERLRMYQESEIDTIGLFPSVYHVRQAYVEEYYTEPENGVFCVAFVPDNPPFDDPQVRRAFVMAVDRERLASVILDGMHDPGTGGLIPTITPGHSPGIGLPYDPDQARQLLEKAGYPDGQGFPETKIQWHQRDADIEFLQEQWLSNLNIEVAIEIREWEDIYDWFYKASLRFTGVAGDIDPDIESGVRIFLPEWRDARFEKLMEEARQSITQSDRIRIYQRADKLLIEEAIIMPISYGRLHLLIKPWVRVPPGESNSWYLKDFIIEPH